MSDCSVYVIGFDLDKGPSKVGIASDPRKRMAALQTGHFQKLILAGYWSLPDREIAGSLERAFHVTQKKTRLSGEWFDLSPQQAMALLYIGLGTMLNIKYGLSADLIDEVIESSRQ